MCKLKVSLLILVFAASVLAEENSTEVQQKLNESAVASTAKPQTKATTTEEPSFFYRWASWFNPFSRSSHDHVPDLVSEATHHQQGGQYLQSSQNNYQQPPCNPCDQEPWVPIAGQSGRSTVIGFVHPSHLGSASNSYGPTHAGAPLLNSYGAPAVPQPLPNSQYRPPQQTNYDDQSGYPSIDNPTLVLPPKDNSYRTLTNKFMPPPPQKGAGYNFQQTLRLKPVASKFNHPKPLGHGPPIPLNYGKPNHNYAPQFTNNFQKFHNKLVPPSTSYGIPVQNDLHTANSQHFGRYPNQYVRPHTGDQKFASNGVKLPFDYYPSPSARVPLAPVPFPQLSLTPVAPLHNYQPFHSVPDNYLQNHQQRPPMHDVQVVPSIQVAGYLASIEHPVNIIQSPLVEVNASDDSQHFDSILEEPKAHLDQNPIVVEEDNNAAASVQNATYHDSDQNAKLYDDKHDSHLLLTNNASRTHFTAPPPFDYNNWTPSMHPPPIQDHSWFSSTLNEDQFASSTKKPKQVQIVIPYTSQVNDHREHQHVPLITLPPQNDAFWTKFVDHHPQESHRVTSTATTERPYTTVLNIKDFLLKEQQWNRNYKNLPYDVVRLQKNIDVWTEKEYSKNHVNVHKDSTVSKLVPSKKIPSEYLTTLPYHRDTTTLESVHEHKIENIEDNLIAGETTELPSTTYETTTTTLPTTNSPSSPSKSLLPSLAAAKSMWEKLQVSVSPLTKEKIYVVTPQPWNFTPEEINQKLLRLAQFANIPLSSPKFSVIIQPPTNATKNQTKEVIRDAKNGIQVVYSEWPHLINNLLTSTTEPPKPATKHPLFGLMDISSYTPPPNSTVETYGGHSKVITVVTPTSVVKKKAKIVKSQ